jgi:hypothetical protein
VISALGLIVFNKHDHITMNYNLSSHEMSVQTNHFPECNGVEPRPNLAFVYPPEFSGDAVSIANTLQSAMLYLKKVTGKDPTRKLGSRVVIGYNKQCTCPTWSAREGNRIRLPWNKYLNKEKEPLDVCSHELVHPFFFVSPLHEINEFWGEGFCDFLRGPLKNFMGLDGNEWWRRKVKETRDNKQDRGGNAAGQLILRACECCGVVIETDQLVDDLGAIREFVNDLYSAPAP